MKQYTLNEVEIVYKRKQQLNYPSINSSKEFADIFREVFPENQLQLKEYFKAAYLDRANKIINIHHIGEGGLSSVVVDIRLIMMAALKVPCSYIILCHNHPSGKLIPSKADLAITQKVKEAANLFDIKLVDHIILGSDREYFSFLDDGCL